MDPVPAPPGELGEKGELAGRSPGDHRLESDHGVHEIGVGEPGEIGGGEIEFEPEDAGGNRFGHDSLWRIEIKNGWEHAFDSIGLTCADLRIGRTKVQ